MDASTPQPAPRNNNRVPIVELVIDDLIARRAHGLEKYGTELKAFNGRNAKIDRYQELMDALLYLRQEIEEDDELKAAGPVVAPELAILSEIKKLRDELAKLPPEPIRVSWPAPWVPWWSPWFDLPKQHPWYPTNPTWTMSGSMGVC